MRRIPTLLVAGSSLLVTACVGPEGAEVGTATHQLCQDLGNATVQRDGARLLARGALGCADALDPHHEVAAVLHDLDAADVSLTLRAFADEHDALGQRHIRYAQEVNGLPVAAGDLVAHIDVATETIIGIDGMEARPLEAPGQARIEGPRALAVALEELGLTGAPVGEAQLTYVATDAGETRLSWAADVAYQGPEGPALDRVFASALDGSYLTRHPRHHSALNRRIYSANNQEVLPGTVVINEGGASNDQAAQAAYDNAGIVYEYYLTKHGRDSFNGAGARLDATVHFGQNYGNAFWNGQQMAYGDGDGQYLGNTALSFDIVAHELTHAVVQYTANLVYQNESGALNEAWADIMGASAEAHRRGAITPEVWLLAEDVWTPGIAGDAMRYLDNPTLDGISYDYYPERYRGQQDYGGVHLNSGIANLAYALLVQGGTHPRTKTVYDVPALGIAQAERIFYRALTTYMTPNTNFAGARTATVQAATDLYGANAAKAVHYAWDAVGVDGTPTRAPVALGILSPADGAEVNPGFRVTTQVTEGDDFDIARAELIANGTSVGVVSAPPFEFPTSNGLPLGPVTLELKTYDRSGNERTVTSTATLVPGSSPDPDQPGGNGGDGNGDGTPGSGLDRDIVGGCSAGHPGSALGLALLVLLGLAPLRRRKIGSGAR